MATTNVILPPVKVDPDVAERLQLLADREERTRSALIRRAVEQLVAETDQ